MLTNQLKTNDLRNIKEAFILEHFFNIFPAFRKLCSLEFSYLFIIALQIGKP